jgi:hypothetical protein
MEPNVIRIEKSGKTIIATIFFSFFITGGFIFYTWFKINQGDALPMWLTVVLAAIVLFLDIRCWQWVLDTDPGITINKEGILYKKKMLLWENIKSYQTILRKPTDNEGSPDEQVLINFKDDKKLSVDLVGLKTNLADMRMHITRFAGDKIADEGHVEK